MRTLLAVALLVPGQDPDWPQFNEIPQKTVKRLDDQVKNHEWKGVFDLYDAAYEKPGDKLLRDPRDSRRLLGLAEWIRERVAAAPGGPEAFRDRYDGQASAAFRTARDARDWSALERAADRFPFATGAREALDTVAHQRFAVGETASAAGAWQKLLALLKPDDPLLPVVACRLGSAYVTLQDGDHLAALRAKGITGRVKIGDRVRSVEEYLASLQIETAGPVFRPPEWRLPALRYDSPDCLRPELFLGKSDMKRDAGNRTTGGSLRTAGAWERRGERDYLIVSNGRRIVAFDPSRADGQTLDRGIYWRWPENAPVRGETNVVLPHGAVFGISIEGETLVATMLGDQAPLQGRGRQPYDGPTRVVGIDLRTGRELWDTLKLTSQHRGKPVPLFEPYGFGDREYNFTAPPILRRGRVYLPVVTNPQTEREVYAVCLDAATGRPVWSTMAAIGQINPTTLFATLAVDERGVYVASNVGAVVALDALTGSPRWASTYPSFAIGTRSRYGAAPALFGGRVYVLAHDAAELMAFETETGARVPVVWTNRKDPARIEWSKMKVMTEVAPGLLVAAGDEPWLLNLAWMRFHVLPKGAHQWSGPSLAPPRLTAEALYIPYQCATGEALAIFERDSWKSLPHTLWPQNLSLSDMIIGNQMLALHGKELQLYTGMDAMDRAFAPRVDLEPPVAETCLQYAKLLRGAGRWAAAFRVYERFLRAAEGDPAWAVDVLDTKRWLAENRRNP